MVEIKAVFINLHGKVRKIETGVAPNSTDSIKHTLSAIPVNSTRKPNFVEIQRAFYKGGFKDSNGKNIQKQFKNIEAKHNEKL